MVLATVATVIASQAVITGAFSMTQQAIQLGLLPRMRHPAHLGDRRPARSTCRRSTGCCWSACVLLVLLFRLVRRDLAAAYGIAVTGDHGGDTLAGLIVVICEVWNWSALAAHGRA